MLSEGVEDCLLPSRTDKVPTLSRGEAFLAQNFKMCQRFRIFGSAHSDTSNSCVIIPGFQNQDQILLSLPALVEHLTISNLANLTLKY